MGSVRKGLIGLAVACMPVTAWSQSIEEAQRAQIERLRQEIAGEVQLSAYNLVDELVYGWTQSPVFGEPTNVVLAGVSVPVGLGTALAGLLENHLTSVLLKNRTTNMVLTHCPSCTGVLVHSGPEGTVVSRGYDNPKALERLESATTKYALFVDVEAEGTWLVLRARITRLDKSLPIVWARTLTSAASAPSLLRQPDDIKSVEEAKEEYIDALKDRGPLSIPARLSVRLYNDSGDTTSINPPPFVWLMTGAELAVSQARAWTASFLIGYGYVPSSYDGFMVQVRMHRLLTGTSRSFTRPDLYAFVGASIFTVSGPSAQIFRREQLSTEDIIALVEGNNQPRQTFSSVHAGIELRLGNRLGMSMFGELLPAHLGSSVLGRYFGVFNSIGTEISVWF